MMQQKADNFWFGPNEEIYNEGFDDLFNVAQDYQIPTAPKKEPNFQDDFGKNLQVTVNKFKTGVLSKMFNKEKQEDLIPSPSPVETKPALKVVDKPTYAASNEVVVLEPRCFDDSLDVVNNLKERKSVILNLQSLDDQESQRVIDFVSGATFAFGGSQQRVGNGVFIFAHPNCKIETESASEKAYKDIFAKTFGI